VHDRIQTRQFGGVEAGMIPRAVPPTTSVDHRGATASIARAGGARRAGAIGPEATIALLNSVGLEYMRIELEVGPLSQRLVTELAAARSPVASSPVT
jgi:hypothetical protein